MSLQRDDAKTREKEIFDRETISTAGLILER